ncbi:MAG TPA: hypothetical protein VGF82_27065 [Terracidiphilus sp.]|jgi:hypothetical protein
MLAFAAFFPVTVCTGYLACWFTNLFQFRRRSLVERLLWSIPSSIAVSTFIAVALTWLISLTAAVWFFVACGIFWALTIAWELRTSRVVGKPFSIGFNPLGTTVLILALVYCVFGVLSLVDIQRDHQLFMSMTIYDHGTRVSWIDSILRTGIPPANPLFWYKHAAPMRNYYYWYVVCAVIVRLTQVSSRCALIASCVWSGLGLASITGLFLKHFLQVRTHLRRQFLTAMLLLAVCGLDIVIHAYNILVLQIPLFDRAGVWPEINSWYVTLSLAPHHMASLVCCMFAFLLAWMTGRMAGREERPRQGIIILLIGFASAAAFGLSVYVAFAFFLIAIAWSLWQVFVEHSYRSALILISGGALGTMLDSPYIRSLSQSSSGIHGSAPFGFAVRETFPPDALLATSFFQQIAANHPNAARNLANLLLLPPGLAVELGFFLAVFFIYLVPLFHKGKPLDPERRTLVFLAGVSILISSFIKSQVLLYNDFGFRAALFAQFALLLLGSEVLTSWKDQRSAATSADGRSQIPNQAPHWLRAATAFALVFGVPSTLYYAAMFRFVAPLTEAVRIRATHDPLAQNLSHDAYLSFFGYRQLNASIPRDAIVQFNPSYHIEYWTVINLVGIRHQTAATYDRPWCGAELGGDPDGCLAMGPPLAGIYKDASAQQARSTCTTFGIQFLVATIYDPVWKDRNGWVWHLPPIVQQPEFRALDCREQSTNASTATNDLTASKSMGRNFDEGRSGSLARFR